MTAEDVARANQFRDGFELVDYAEVGLPVFRLTLEAFTTSQRATGRRAGSPANAQDRGVSLLPVPPERCIMALGACFDEHVFAGLLRPGRTLHRH